MDATGRQFFNARSDDVERQATLLRGWNQSYAQISAGRFAGSLTEALLGDEGRLFSEFTGQTLLQSGELPPDLIAIGVPQAMGGTSLFCGKEGSAKGLYLFSGRSGFEFYSPPEMTMLGAVVSRAALLEILPEMECDLLETGFGDAGYYAVDERAADGMKDFITGTLEIFASAPHLLMNEPVVRTLGAGILSNLAQLFATEPQPVVDRLDARRRWSIVSQARDLVASQPDRAFTVAELCHKIGVSRRTLQYCFQDVLNLNPVAFLRAVRLNGARRMLCKGSSVMDAATHWGFWHFGHFANDYAALFGELPSETSRRYRS